VERAAEVAEGIVDAWGAGGEDFTGDEAVLLKVAEGVGEDAGGDVADAALELAEAKGAFFKAKDDEHAPLVSDAVEDVAHGALVGVGPCGEEAVGGSGFEGLHGGLTYLEDTKLLIKPYLYS